MQFNDTTNLSGIIQACERYCNLGNTGISGNATLLKEFTNFTNTTMRRIWHSIFEATGSWEYDDSNQTDLPQATTDLDNGVAKYTLPNEALTVKRLEIKNTAGDWDVLTPLLRDEIKVGIDEYRVADGLPTSYRIVGRTIELFPAPNYDSTSGLKVYFDRGSVAFASTDTTKAPGFASEYHDLVPIGASLEWMKIKTPTSATTAQLKEDYQIGLQNLKTFFNKRFSAKKKIMRRAYHSYK